VTRVPGDAAEAGDAAVAQTARTMRSAGAASEQRTRDDWQPGNDIRDPFVQSWPAPAAPAGSRSGWADTTSRRKRQSET
jgi:hypothetical protein